MNAGAKSLAAVALLCVCAGAAAQSSISVGDVIVDPPTRATLGFSVPILSGDDNYDAVADVTFREVGAPTWKTALPLLRVRPETISNESPPEDFGYSRPGEQFAGSVFHLEPDTAYEVRIDVSDPDGGSRTQTVEVTTQQIPRRQPVRPRTIAVNNAAELASALQNAVAGDVIALAAGTYAGRFDVVNRSGTQDNPIVIRGPVAGGAVLDGTGQTVALNISDSAHVNVEHLHIVGVTGSNNYGLRLRGNNHAARNLVLDTDNGIDASSDDNRGFYICDNELQGPTVWPIVAVGGNVSEKLWIGIEVRGRGHTVCHNSLSGYGSTLLIGFRGDSDPLHHLAIDLHNNDLAWSADDGIEFDGSLRNVRAWQNRVRNSLQSLSFSPVWGGPIYAFRNVVYNNASSPLKLNNDPSGVILYNNTFVRYAETDINGSYDGNAWPQLGLAANYAANSFIRNNIFIGNDDALGIRQEMHLLTLDQNAYSPNGQFRFQISGVVNTYADLTAFNAGTGYEANGLALNQTIFENPPPTSADYKIFAPALDFVLHSQSNAIDTAALLPNVNDNFSGAAPDLGALEFGMAAPEYGVRDLDTMPPAAPGNLTVTVP